MVVVRRRRKTKLLDGSVGRVCFSQGVEELVKPPLTVLKGRLGVVVTRTVNSVVPWACFTMKGKEG